MSAWIRSRAPRRQRRARRSGLPADRRTLALGLLAVTATAAVITVEFSRVLRKGSAPSPAEAEDPLLAVAEAAAETAEVARTGYREVSTRENSMFNLLTSFVVTFVTARSVTTLLRGRSTVGPFRDLKVGRRHIHHFVPGIVLAFAAGGAAIVTRDEAIEPLLAIPFGVGMGLTLDESALLLELDDVYWTEEGVISVQIALAVTAMLSSVALAMRFLRRGEEVVLESPPAEGLGGR
ncbi:MAG: hypothetical protein H0U24_00100 [Thermoleophilaceae bacterium]|nr:hypothetical protein [Thermoleophilaceae bacterium]